MLHKLPSELSPQHAAAETVQRGLMAQHLTVVNNLLLLCNDTALHSVSCCRLRRLLSQQPLQHGFSSPMTCVQAGEYLTATKGKCGFRLTNKQSVLTNVPEDGLTHCASCLYCLLRWCPGYLQETVAKHPCLAASRGGGPIASADR